MNGRSIHGVRLRVWRDNPLLAEMNKYEFLGTLDVPNWLLWGRVGTEIVFPCAPPALDIRRRVPDERPTFDTCSFRLSRFRYLSSKKEQTGLLTKEPHDRLMRLEGYQDRGW